jgi:rare lipoprotein A
LTTDDAFSIRSATALLSTKGWALSGKHARERSRSRTLIPVVAGLAVAALLVTGAVAAMNMGPARTASTTTVQAEAPSPTPAPSRSAQKRASRGQLRAVPPKPSPTPSKTKSATVTSTGSCQASYYGTGTTTANGERFDPTAYTAAHKTLPFNTRVRVTNKSNGKSVTVRINDRGPFVAGRCLDLTTAAFQAIASLSSGVVSVTYQVLG